MLKPFVSGIILASAVLLLSAPSQAGSKHHPRSHVQRHQRHQPSHTIKRHVRHHRPRRHVRHHRRHDHHHHRGHHHRHRRHRVHRPRHNVFVGVHIGGHHRPHYPHGHYQHIHNDYCPVVIVPHVVYHHTETVEWEVEYHDADTPEDETSVYLILAPHHGDVYINGQYIGHARSFERGQKRVRVPSGNHTIELKTSGQSYTQEVTVNPGVTAVVKAKHL